MLNRIVMNVIEFCPLIPLISYTMIPITVPDFSSLFLIMFIQLKRCYAMQPFDEVWYMIGFLKITQNMIMVI